MNTEFFRVRDGETVTITHFFVESNYNGFKFSAKFDVEKATIFVYEGSGFRLSMPREVADEIRANGPDAEAKAVAFVRRRFPASVGPAASEAAS